MALAEQDHNNPWLNISRKYHVHIESLQYTNKCSEMQLKPNSELSIQEARSQAVQFSRTVNGNCPFVGSVKEFDIPTSNTEGGIPITVYMPECSPAVPAILVYFHGGGLLIGSRETNERSLHDISAKTGTIIVNVGYRLLPCPEDVLAPFNDAVNVTDWVMKNKEAIGGSSESAVGVGGDNAGGHIACSVTEDIEGLNFQILIYPTVVNLSSHFESYDEFLDIPVFNTTDLKWQLHLTNLHVSAENNNSRTDILARENLESSPSTLMIAAQLDPLRDAILLYAHKLDNAGVKVQTEIIDGVPHGFFSFPGIFRTKTAETFELIIDFLKTFQ